MIENALVDFELHLARAKWASMLPFSSPHSKGNLVVGRNPNTRHDAWLEKPSGEGSKVRKKRRIFDKVCIVELRPGFFGLEILKHLLELGLPSKP